MGGETARAAGQGVVTHFWGKIEPFARLSSDPMSTIFIVILAILAVLSLPWFIGVPLGAIGLLYVAWPRFASKEEQAAAQEAQEDPVEPPTRLG